MASTHHSSGLVKAQSVEEIVQEAANFEFSIHRPLRQWIRSGKQLLTEASFCEDDGNLQMAYLYLYRYAELILEKLPQHPDYKNPTYKEDLVQARKALSRSLPKLEKWKPKISEDHQRYVKAMEGSAGDFRRPNDGSHDDWRRRRSIDFVSRISLGSQDSAPVDSLYALDPSENQELALEFAQREQQRRTASKLAAAQLVDNTSSTAGSYRYNDHKSYGDATREIMEAGRRINQHGRSDSNYSTTRSNDQVSSIYSYPVVPPKQARYGLDSPPPLLGEIRLRDAPPPIRPAKEPLYDQHTSELPARPAREPLYNSSVIGLATAPPIPGKRRLTADEHVAPPSPSSRYTFKSSARTESGALLRSMFLPPDLRTEFLNLAHANTARNLETCGILCGTLISNALFIDHLIIPGQTSTSDTCDTTETGDNALFDYCDSHQLLVCGWIHTHPSQSCFLSSRDLHTCSGYQVMLPEAIAIVCAPRHSPDWGIYRLTEPPGLRHILDCRQTGIFHPHSETNLYTDALRPGHVVEGAGLKFKVVDLRT